MPDVENRCGEIKATLRKLTDVKVSPTARLVAVLATCGITDNAEVASLVGRSVRMVQVARNELRETHCADAQPIAPSATHCVKPIASGETHCVESEMDCAPRVHARAQIELPSEVNSSLEVNKPSPLIPPAQVDADEFQRFRKRLENAAGEALDDPARSPSLINPSAVLAWLDGGAHPELDILPAVQSVAAKAKPRSIRSWEYFTRQVAENRARRSAGLPVVRLPADSASDRQLREIAMI